MNTLEKIKKIIQDDQLLPGDKLPSERELSDRLAVGRSSVREALRALELLGIIETRRGEGTYIQDARDNHLIPLLGTFILQDSISKKDLLEMNEMLEIQALMLILGNKPIEKLKDLQSQLIQKDEVEIMTDLMKLADNFLLYRIWSVLHQFVRAVLPPAVGRSREDFEHLLHHLIHHDQEKVVQVYQSLSYKTVGELEGTEIGNDSSKGGFPT
ncbi:FadR/GntR family transcriptional regulator [Bacillus kexueae]|uniref:FadR/GntR family transcriptional regulator n=1 Tax=Aeribacillus kexueae TaxID=2078952 RepID=UPI001FB01712